MKTNREKIILEFLLLFVLHYTISFLLKYFVFKDVFNWKVQLLETFLFSLIMVFVFGFLKKRNNTRKNNNK